MRSRAPGGRRHDARLASAERRYRVGYLLVGFLSLAWLMLRSGVKPSRLAYPCQQAAAKSGLGFLAYLASLVGSAPLYRVLRRHLAPRLALLCAVLLVMLLLHGEAPERVSLSAGPVLPTWTHSGAVSDVFAVTDVPTPTVSLEGGVLPVGVSPAEALHDGGVDALVDLMASQGTSFYRTSSQPEGLFARDDVVVIKVNAQWNCGTGADNRRAHTNVDVTKGLIYRIVQHPEGFSGAVVIAENGQGVPAQLDCPDHNNAEDAQQSYQDVADAFLSQGYNVCTYVWDAIRTHIVGEYDSGDHDSGYVLLQDGTPGTNQLSYPKFAVTCGPQSYEISMRHGLWDGTAYDNAKLKMVNLPVLKRHGMAGATAAVKNYIGFLTTAERETRFGDFAEMHDYFWGYGSGSEYGLLGRQLARIRRADLNVVDAIWVNPVDGWHEEDQAVRANILLASTDPFAVDYYSSAYVLVPHMTPGSAWAHDADARHHGGDFRGLLMTNENRARTMGMTDTIDLEDSYTAEEEQEQFNAFVADASSPPGAALSLAVEPASRAVRSGETAVYRLSSMVEGGYARAVTVTLSGAPPGAAAVVDPDPMVAPGTGHQYITTTASTPAGTYPMTLVAAAGALTSTASLRLVVDPALSLSVTPTVRTVVGGGTATYTISLAGSVGMADIALEGVPSGASAAFEPNPVSVPGQSQLYMTTTASTVAGVYPMTITAASGDVEAATQVTLIATSDAPGFAIQMTPGMRVAAPGQSVTYTCSIVDLNGFSDPVDLVVVGLPASSEAAWSSNPVAPGASSVLTIDTEPVSPLGRFELWVVGTAAGDIAAEGIDLVLAWPPRAYLPLIQK